MNKNPIATWLKSNSFTVLLILISIPAAMLAKQYVHGQRNTEVEIAHKVIDIGTITEDKHAIGQFKIKNTGTSDLYIQYVEADCHCTNVVWDSLPIQPQEETIIQVEYDKELPGVFQQLLTVYTNTEHKKDVLIFRGNTQK